MTDAKQSYRMVPRIVELIEALTPDQQTALKASGFFLESDMAKQSKTKFLKRQKEFDRMKKAREKMDRRHGKIDKEKEESVSTETLDPSEQA